MEQTEKITKINILGSEWMIEYRKASEDPILREGNGGYTDSSIRMIVIEYKKDGFEDSEVSDFREIQKRYIRHEIIHAFLYESGLGENFTHPEYGHDETMVDWIATQFPKIVNVCKEVGCL